MIKLGDSAMDELIVVRGSYRITYNDRIDRWYIWNAKGPYLEVKGFRTKQEAIAAMEKMMLNNSYYATIGK